MNSYRDVLLHSFSSANNTSASVLSPPPRDAMTASVPDVIHDTSLNRAHAKFLLSSILGSITPLTFDEKMVRIGSLTYFQILPQTFDVTKALCKRYQAYSDAVNICLTNALFLQNLLTLEDAKEALNYIFYCPERRDILNKIDDYTYYNIGAYTSCAAKSCDSHYVDIFQIAKTFQTAEANTLALLNVFVDIIKRNKDVHRFSLVISRDTLARIFLEAPFLLVQQYVESLRELDPHKKSVKSGTRYFLLNTIEEAKVLPTMVSRFWKALDAPDESEISALTHKIDLYWDMINGALDRGMLSSDEVNKLRRSILAMMEDQPAKKNSTAESPRLSR
jgi:hypothetical protein